LSDSRGLVKSMLVIGSANGVKILLALVRMKVLAVLLGPTGVGLLSIYNSLQGTASTAAGLGMSSSGVRELASSKGAESDLSRVRRVLLAAHLAQGALAMVAIWLLRHQIAVWLLDSEDYATEVALVGAAVLLTLLMSAHTALLQGLRRIGDLGRVTVLGALGGTAVGVAAVWLFGKEGLIWFVIAQPLTGLGVALFYTQRLPRPTGPRLTLAAVWSTWKPMAKLGSAFMFGGLLTAGTLLLVRGRIAQELGLDAAGQFAAAWGITMTYVGFLLSAMAADYYPRLAEVIGDRPAAIGLMNDQAQLGLAIGGPVLLLLIGLAPWAITLLYSAEFEDAVTLLQWQTVGNVFKLASWALGFSIVAAARARMFFFLQANFNLIFLFILWPTLSKYGIISAGPSFAIAYMVHFMIVNGIVRHVHGFRWQRMSLGLLLVHATLAAALLALALVLPVAAAFAAPILAIVTGIVGLRIVLDKIGPTGRIAAPIAHAYSAFGWPIRRTL